MDGHCVARWDFYIGIKSILMTNLIIFNIGIALLVGLGLFVVRNSDRMARERREAPKRRQKARQAELRRKLKSAHSPELRNE